MNIEANIEITRNGKKLAISVLMPVRNRLTHHDNLFVELPLLGINTIAKDENDIDKAVEEAITSFCIASNKFGQGIEKELQALGVLV